MAIYYNRLVRENLGSSFIYTCNTISNDFNTNLIKISTQSMDKFCFSPYVREWCYSSVMEHTNGTNTKKCRRTIKQPPPTNHPMTKCLLLTNSCVHWRVYTLIKQCSHYQTYLIVIHTVSDKSLHTAPKIWSEMKINGFHKLCSTQFYLYFWIFKKSNTKYTFSRQLDLRDGMTRFQLNKGLSTHRCCFNRKFFSG